MEDQRLDILKLLSVGQPTPLQQCYREDRCRIHGNGRASVTIIPVAWCIREWTVPVYAADGRWYDRRRMGSPQGCRAGGYGHFRSALWAAPVAGSEHGRGRGCMPWN